jgi:splicing factor U2AF 35 kDa subunit
MSDHLPLNRIFGTEDDKVNCPFYYKIGACRHGNRCSRMHNRPNFSQSILIPNMYKPSPQAQEDPEEFADFCDEILDELKKFGRVEEVNVCQNLGDHLFGNVYIKYSSEEEAEKAMAALQGRFYAGQMLQVEYSPVTDFREARCRQHDENNCTRGGYCNFMHLKETPEHLKSYLKDSRRKRRSRSPGRGRGRDDYYKGSRRSYQDEEYDEVGIRSNSKERRRLIAKWNRRREEQGLLASQKSGYSSNSMQHLPPISSSGGMY